MGLEDVDVQSGQLCCEIAENDAIVRIYETHQHRWLTLNSAFWQSLLFKSASERLLLPSAQYLCGYALFQTDLPQRVLLLGLGGGDIVRFHQHLGRSMGVTLQLDVVEHHAMVIDVAQRFFICRENANTSFWHADGSAFVQAVPGNSYDVILVDLADADGMPAATATAAFQQACHAALTANGLLAVNLMAHDRQAATTIVTLLRYLFERRVLLCRIPGYANVIVLAFKSPPSTLRRAPLERHAKQLEVAWHLPYCNILKHFFEQNQCDGLWAQTLMMPDR